MAAGVFTYSLLSPEPLLISQIPCQLQLESNNELCRPLQRAHAVEPGDSGDTGHQLSIAWQTAKVV